MAHPRSDHGAVNYQGNIYLFGGQSYDPKNSSLSVVIANMTQYNMYLGIVQEMQPMPEVSLNLHSVASHLMSRRFLFTDFDPL